ncbi:MAG: hypothetical protein LBC47_06225 [Tannerella sp.]|jgi:hypothetical protein|nr:hypothetical protein [Tannerella sp.]
MKSKDFIPEKDSAFIQWVVNFLAQLVLILDRIGFPEVEYTLLTTQKDDFAAKFKLAEEPSTRTKVTVKNKNDSRAILEKTLRADIKEFVSYNRRVTGGDREALGLPIYKTGRTPSPVAKKAPYFKVDTGTIRRLVFHYYGEEAGEHARAKPPGQKGAEMCWAILATPPSSIDELIHSSFDTDSPLILDFDENQRGTTVYFCFRWENTTGKKGPWSEIAGAIIP